MGREFNITEEKVKGITGLSQERLQVLRVEALASGTDWRRDRYGIFYSQLGLERLLAEIGAQLTGAFTGPEKPGGSSDTGLEQKNGVAGQADGAAPEKEAGVTLRVAMVCPNPTWVIALTETGERVQCRVRTSVYMRKGTILRGCLLMEDGRRYRYPRL